MENITLTNIEVNPVSGLKKTIALMNELERLSFYKPLFIKWIHETFQSSCAPCVPGKVWKYVMENFQFVSDEPFDERITAPYLMDQTREGDCDDFALFIKTCMDVLGGWHTSYILFGRERNKFTHIAVFVHRGILGNKYIDPIVIDGANQNFNIIPTQYGFYKII